MSPLRQKMIREAQLRQFAPSTIKAYVWAVKCLSVYHGRSPDHINCEEARSYLHYLLTERKVSFSTCNQQTCGITFFFRHVLGMEKIDLKAAHLFMANHASFFDFFILGGYLPPDSRGLEAAEHFKWPIWGIFLRKTETIPIDRSNPRASMTAIKIAGQDMKTYPCRNRVG